MPNEISLLYSIYEIIISSFIIFSNIIFFDGNRELVINTSLYLFAINNLILLSYNIYQKYKYYNIYNDIINISKNIIILLFIGYYYVIIKKNIDSFILIRILLFGEITNIIKYINEILLHTNYIVLYRRLSILYFIINIFIKLLISIVIITLTQINDNIIFNIPFQIIASLYIIYVIYYATFKINHINELPRFIS